MAGNENHESIRPKSILSNVVKSLVKMARKLKSAAQQVGVCLATCYTKPIAVHLRYRPHTQIWNLELLKQTGN